MIIVVIAIIALIWLLRRRHKAAAAAAAEPTVGAAPDRSAGDEIAHTWRQFVRALPGRARRALDEFHPVVVLGTESAGKAELIERFSGVNQRRAEIGAPAELTGGDLRLHLGSEILVMELSEEACRARMDTVGAGLRRAFGPALRRRTPIVAVCLSPESLEKRSEQDLRELGGALCAKIALLADLRGEPVEVRVVMPLVAAATRVRPLFLLTQLPGVSPVLPLGHGEEPALRAQLLAFTDLLTEVLATRGADDALGVVDLLEAVPALSQSLSAFVSELLDGGAQGRIRSGGLYLVPETGGPNPLEVPAALVRPQDHPLIKHRLISLTAAAAVLVWLAAGYVRQKAAWETAANAAARYDFRQRDEAMVRQEILDYAHPEGAGAPLDSLFPRYFINGPQVVGCAFVEQIREGPLRRQLTEQICRSAPDASPALKASCSGQSTDTPSPPEDILYVLGLLYASTDNDLGTLIKQERTEWAKVSLSLPVIDDYLKLAGPNKDVRLFKELWSYKYAASQAGELGQVAAFLDPLTKPRLKLDHPTALARRANAVRELLIDRGRFGHAADVMGSRVFGHEPLHGYKSVFDAYRPRFALLQELTDSQSELEKIIDTVTAGTASAREATPDLPSLVEGLGAVLDEKQQEQTHSVAWGEKTYDVDLAVVAKALRDGKVRGLVDAFADGASHDDLVLLGFHPEDKGAKVFLRARWPEGLTSPDSLPRPYTREGFEKSVKPNLLAVGKLLGRMDDLAPQRKRIERIVRDAVEDYASDYEAALDRCYDGFRMAAMQTAGLKRVLRTLSSGGSPMRAFVDDIANNSPLPAENEKEKDEAHLLDPVRAVQAKYAPIAKLSDPDKPSGPLVSYLDILQDALLRLDASAAPAAAATSTFVAGLSPLGKLGFDALADPKTSPLEAARKWAHDQGLDDELARPFLEPLQRLSEQGVADLGRSLGELDRDLERRLKAELLSRYPFNPRAADEVDPDDLEEWLNPKRGRVMRDFLAGLEPLIQQVATYDGPHVWAAGGACAEDAGCARGLQPLLATLNGLTPVTALLWTDDGKTQPLRLRVVPQPLHSLGNGAPRPVAVRLVAGEEHVDYFNQKPAETLLELDWTKRQTSTLSVDLASKDPVKSFEPPALVVSGTPWSLLRLLQKGQRHGTTRTWQIPTDEGNAVSVSLTVRENATDAFRIHAGGRHRRGSRSN